MNLQNNTQDKAEQQPKKKKLIITLSPQATAQYLSIMQKQTTAEVNADVEPSGARLLIDIHPIINEASLLSMGKNFVLGDVEINFTEIES